MCSMSSSLPEGVTVRPAVEADAAAAADVYHAAETVLRGRSLWDAADVLGWWRLVDLPTDTWLLHEDGELVAVGTLILHGGAGRFGGAVRPDRVGRGLGSALLAMAEKRSRAAGADALRVDVCAEDEAAVALLTKRGHRDARHYFTMRIDLDEPPAAPRWPDGIRPDTFRPDDARAFKAALDESFADEWGWAPIDFEEWKRLRLEAPDFDPKLLFIACDGDELAAVAHCKCAFGGGWVATIGVRPAWRRRGLGRALLLEAFSEFRRRGESAVRLGVDARNPTGATRLYESVGMTVEFEAVVYEKELA
jgi:mycothiol synthase